MNNKTLVQLIKEEIKLFNEENRLTVPEIKDIADKLMAKLDSIDMSLDLILGTLSGGTEPVDITRSRYKALGVATRPRGSLGASRD